MGSFPGDPPTPEIETSYDCEYFSPQRHKEHKERIEKVSSSGFFVELQGFHIRRGLEEPYWQGKESFSYEKSL